MTLQLTQETALDYPEDSDLILTKEQFDRLDQHVKRRFVAEATSDEINGRSTMLEQQSYLVRQRTLTEYAKE